MPITNEQISFLLKMIASSESDCLDCDGCFEHLAEFAESELMAREIPEALRVVERHLEQCPCCKDEYQALLEGLRSLESNDEYNE